MPLTEFFPSFKDLSDTARARHDYIEKALIEYYTAKKATRQLAMAAALSNMANSQSSAIKVTYKNEGWDEISVEYLWYKIEAMLFLEMRKYRSVFSEYLRTVYHRSKLRNTLPSREGTQPTDNRHLTGGERAMHLLADHLNNQVSSAPKNDLIYTPIAPATQHRSNTPAASMQQPFAEHSNNRLSSPSINAQNLARPMEQNLPAVPQPRLANVQRPPTQISNQEVGQVQT